MNFLSFFEAILFPFKSINQTKLSVFLDRKTILITGASYGIGEALANYLSTMNVHLILIARTETKLNEIKQKIEKNGATVSVFAVDLCKQTDVGILIDRLLASNYKIDLLISNAGHSIHRSVFDALDRFHDYTRTIGVNYLGPVQLILALIPSLKQTKGQIINISALNVLLPPMAKWSAYQASKTAFDQWFRCVSPELKVAKIVCSSIYLPLVATRMLGSDSKYNVFPKMTVEKVVGIVCLLIVNKSKHFKPWWFFFVPKHQFFWTLVLVLTQMSRKSKLKSLF